MTCLEIARKHRRPYPYMTTWELLEEVDTLMSKHKWWVKRDWISPSFRKALIKRKMRDKHEAI